MSIADQCLEVLENGVVARRYPVSTSRFGTGTEPGSFRTPTGGFRIAAKIGAGAPPGSIFRSRLPTGAVHAGGGEEDAVLTRILWLDGCDAENANTRDRYIYIHGTNREDLLGQPASMGCIRMANADIIELFDMVGEGTRVVIA
ncbi:MAG: L,D-transpeptidase [Terrimicrobiaceae bacterium]|nr:L,D-transpeptidase [Terrimicrobiaceae bacterium]